MIRHSNALERAARHEQLEPPVVLLLPHETEQFDNLVLRRLQSRGGLAADARKEIIREVIAAGLLVMGGAEGLEKNVRLAHDLVGWFAEDERFDHEERVMLEKFARGFSAAMAVIQQRDRELVALARARG